jgi:hypothetical protein
MYTVTELTKTLRIVYACYGVLRLISLGAYRIQNSQRTRAYIQVGSHLSILAKCIGRWDVVVRYGAVCCTTPGLTETLDTARSAARRLDWQRRCLCSTYRAYWWNKCEFMTETRTSRQMTDPTCRQTSTKTANSESGLWQNLVMSPTRSSTSGLTDRLIVSRNVILTFM